MKKQSLWKRIFGQKTSPKVRAQQAFQEQYDTKLRFRELEPRVVLAATATYDNVANSLTIVYDAAGADVSIGRNGGGFLEVTGATLVGDPFVNTVTSLDDLSVFDDTNGNSTLTFLGIGMGTELTGVLSSDVELMNVDLVTIEFGADFSVTNDFEYVADLFDTDNNLLQIDGKLTTDRFLVTNFGDFETNIVDAVSGELTAANLEIDALGALGSVSVDLSAGSHDFDYFRAIGNNIEASVSDVDDIILEDINVAKLQVVSTGGNITQDAFDTITVDNLSIVDPAQETAIFQASGNITLDQAGNSFAGHVSLSGQIVDVDVTVGSVILDDVNATSLDLSVTNGSITQTTTGVKVTDTATFISGIGQVIDLDTSAANEFKIISATGKGGAASIVEIADSDTNVDDLQLDDVHASTLNVATAGAISQTATGIQVSGVSTFTAGNGLDILLATSGSNKFGTVSAQGATLAAGTVKLDDSEADLTLGTINAADLEVTATNNISQSGTVTVSNDATFTAGNNITLGGANEFQGIVNASGNVVTLNDTSAVTLGSITATTLDVIATGELKDSTTASIVSVTGLASFTGESIKLDNTTDAEGHQLNEVTLNTTGASPTSHAFLKEDDGFSFKGSSAVQGNLTVTTNTNGIGQIDGDLTVDGTTNLTVEDGAAVTLDKANDFVGVVTVSGAMADAGTVTLNDTNAIVLGNINADTVDVTATDAISQDTGTTIDATTSVTLTQNGVGTGITLGNIETDTLIVNADANVGVASGTTINASNSAALTSNTGSVVVGPIETNVLTVDAVDQISFASGATAKATTSATFTQVDSMQPGIILGNVETATLIATAGASISQETGTSITATTSADITSNQKSVTVGAISTDALTVTALEEISFATGTLAQAATSAKFVQNGAATDPGITLGNVQTLNLTVDSQAGVAQQAMTTLDIGGITTVKAGDGKDVTLFNAGNDFTGAVSVSSDGGTPATVKILDADTLLLGNIEADMLQLEATTGNITQAMGTALDIEGTTLATVAGTFDVLLNKAANDFTGAVSVTGASTAGEVEISDGNSLVLGDIDADKLTATAVAAISQATGTSIDADTSASLDAGTTIALGDITTPMLTLISGDAITQAEGSLQVSGMTTIEVGAGVDVTLLQPGNNFGSISVNDGLVDYAGEVKFFDSADGIVLKNIQADVLEVEADGMAGTITQMAGTTIDATTSVKLDAESTLSFEDIVSPSVELISGGAMTLGSVAATTLTVTSGGAVDQAAMTSLKITDMTTVTVGTGENVDLSAAANEFNSIGVTGTGATTAGDVTIVDADGGIVLKDIIAENLSVTVNDTIDTVDVTQLMATSVAVSSTTTITNNTGGNVTLANAGNLFNEIGVTTQKGVTRGDVTLVDEEDGLVFNNIIAANLTATINDTADVVGVSQNGGQTLDVTSMITITNTTGGDVDLSNAMNKIAMIEVTSVDGMTRGNVTITDDYDGLVLKNIVANDLTVTADDVDDDMVVDISQLAATTIDTTGLSTFTNSTGGKIDLSEVGNEFVEFTATSEDAITTDVGDIIVNDDAGALLIHDVQGASLDVDAVGAISQMGGTSINTADSVDLTSETSTVTLGDIMTDKLTVVAEQAIETDLATTVNATTSVDLTSNTQSITLGDINTTDLTATAQLDIDSNLGTTLDAEETVTLTSIKGGITLHDIETKVLLVEAELAIDTQASTTIDALTSVDLTSHTQSITLGDINTTDLTATAQLDVDSNLGTTLDAEESVTLTSKMGGITLHDIETKVLKAEAELAIDTQTATTIDALTSVELTSNTESITLGDINTTDLTATAELAINANPLTTIDSETTVTLTSNMSTVEVANIETKTLTISAGGDISQQEDTLLTIETKTDLTLTAAGSITLLNDGDTDVCLDLDPTDGNDLSADVNLTVAVPANLLNFEILNINAAADIPTGDLTAILPAGTITDLTLKFTQAPLVTLPQIKIMGDLSIESGGDIQQSASVAVGNAATFVANEIHLASMFGHNLNVTGHATFVARTGEIEVGVVSKAIDSIDRGENSAAIVNFDSITFNAVGATGHVTIAEDSTMQLKSGEICMVEVENFAQTAVLNSTGNIVTLADAKLTVADLASFFATNVDLGNAAGSEVDLRILYMVADNASIVEMSDFNGADPNNTALSIVDGTTVSGTAAIQTGGHLIQVNDIHSDSNFTQVEMTNALLVADGAILITNASIDTLAASAGGVGQTTLNVTPGSALSLATAGVTAINSDSGFMTKSTLTTDAIDPFLPDQNSDAFAAPARATGFDAAVGEDYSIVVRNNGDLLIDTVSDVVGGISSVDGLRTYGGMAGDVFLRAVGAGADLTFGGAAPAGAIVGLANNGVITALAQGQVEITTNYALIVTAGTNPDIAAALAAVTTIEPFVDNPVSPYEIDNTAPPTNDGPVYSRIPGNSDTYVLPTQTTVDSLATIVVDMLGQPGGTNEMDFEITMDFGDGTGLQVFTFADLINADTALQHAIPWEFATTNAFTTVTLNAFNSPQINLFESVVNDTTFNNLSVVVDTFNIFFLTPIDFVPEMPEFVPPQNPYVTPIIIQEPSVTPYAALTEIADDTRVATQIDGVTVVQVDPSDFMEIGEEIELDDDFMTLDAVKEYIQNGDQFPPGLYKIEILYPGSEVPEEHFYWKQDRPDPFDLFSRSTKPISPSAAELAAVERTQSQLSAEEVWAREYDKWFPGVSAESDADAFSVPSAEGEESSGDVLPSEQDIVFQRVSQVDLQAIDRVTDRLRAKRLAARDGLQNAMVGGAALMAAVGAQARRDEEEAADDASPNQEAENDLGPAPLNRLQRRVRQWLD
ncbi:beta strand repeat-containing protein [Bremerella sp. T1]|uniref:beta strand repeat-containing protein n=1 Tax=Bremerella sp. TYQ1 TaxID=3119568 RepID=UPI001CCCA0DB|nr:hypothetical protein [Bremerella volcania]UBM33667.1 hypothetical protein LA756_13290 [Bremerella volcania]